MPDSPHAHWQERWREGRISFHKEEANRHLVRHWPTLGVREGGRVLVPLCGKTLDMLHLHSLGHVVVGVELSPIACEAFFAEHDLPFEQARVGNYERFEGTGPATGLTLWCGDYFGLTPDLVGAFAGLYDRAALIAIAPTWRDRYFELTASLLEPRACGLLLTVEFPQDEKDGPPYSVTPALARSLMGTAIELDVLDEEDRSDIEGVRWGLEFLTEYVMSVSLAG